MSYSHTVIISDVSSSSDLKWDGWDVVQYTNKRVSFMNPKAVFVNGEWKTAVRYPVESDGWTVPRRLFNVAG